MTKQQLLDHIARFLDMYEDAQDNKVCLGVYVDLDDSSDIIHEWNGQELVPVDNVEIRKYAVCRANSSHAAFSTRLDELDKVAGFDPMGLNKQLEQKNLEDKVAVHQSGTCCSCGSPDVHWCPACGHSSHCNTCDAVWGCYCD